MSAEQYQEYVRMVGVEIHLAASHAAASPGTRSALEEITVGVCIMGDVLDCLNKWNFRNSRFMTNFEFFRY